MRKIVIGSGLSLVAAAMPAYGASLPVAVEPTGVSEAGRVAFADQATETQTDLSNHTQGDLSNHPQIKQGSVSAYDKMNAEAQLKIKGEYKFNKAGGEQIKAPGNAQVKMNPVTQQKFKPGDFKYGSSGSDGIVRPNCLQAGQ